MTTATIIDVKKFTNSKSHVLRKCVMDNRIGQDPLRRRFKKPVPGHLKKGVEIIPHWFCSEFSSLILLTGTFYFFSETIASLEYSEEEQAELVALKEGKESRCQNGRTYDCHKILQGLRTNKQNPGAASLLSSQGRAHRVLEQLLTSAVPGG